MLNSFFKMLYLSTTPELDFKMLLILWDFCNNQMKLPDAEQRVQAVFIDASEFYNDSKWRPWLSKINDTEEETFEAAEIAGHVEAEIKALQAHLSSLALRSPTSPAPSPRGEPMDVDFDLMTSVSAPLSTTAFSSAPRLLILHHPLPCLCPPLPRLLIFHHPLPCPPILQKPD